jgi:neutral ceramidase
MSTDSTRRTFLSSAGAAVAAGWAGARLKASEASAVGKSARIFRAGAFAIDITPREFPVLINGGVSERTADRAVDPLHARSLVLDDGTTQIAIAAVDNCMVPRALLDEAKEAARAATGIPTERMLISATHTHSAPAVCGCLGTDRDDRYARYLPGRIAEGIKLAYQNLAPARIGWAVGQDPKNIFCRRYLMKPGTALTNPFSGTQDDQAQMNPGYLNPNAIKRLGPVDPDVTVLSVQSPEGQPIALLANYSTHYAGSEPVSADYFGVFCEKIARLLGADSAKPPFVALMSNGTSGDANCCDFDHARREFDSVSVAEDVSRAAYEAYRKIQYHNWVPLVMQQGLLELNVRMPRPEEVAKAKEYIAANLGERKPRTWAEVYARETVLLDRLPSTRELKVQAIRLGDFGIAAIPCEVYGRTGLQIKRSSPLKPTMNISLANGCEGYLPPPDQFPLGGYTTWRARTSCLEVQAEPKIVAAALDLLTRVAAKGFSPDESRSA